MKKLFLISVLTVLGVACSNDAKKEADEKRVRDSLDNLKVDENERKVRAMEIADSIKEANAHQHDSGSHEGHDHSH